MFVDNCLLFYTLKCFSKIFLWQWTISSCLSSYINKSFDLRNRWSILDSIKSIMISLFQGKHLTAKGKHFFVVICRFWSIMNYCIPFILLTQENEVSSICNWKRSPYYKSLLTYLPEKWMFQNLFSKQVPCVVSGN